MSDPAEMFASFVAAGEFDAAELVLEMAYPSRMSVHVAMFAERWAEGDVEGARRRARLASALAPLEALGAA